MSVTLRHKDSNVVKEVKIGFSWTVFFFYAWVPLFRADWKWVLICLFLGPFTFGVLWIFLMFNYNKIFAKELLEKGYVPANDESEDILVSKRIIILPEEV